MKTIGLLGGMSWESTAQYYRIINTATRDRLGGLRSAPLVLVSLDFAEVEALQDAGDWTAAGDLLTTAARSLEAGGAESLVICTNTMHKVADAVAAAVDIPLLHIADATARAVRAAELRTIGLLATRFTMEEDFYRGRLARHGLDVLVPKDGERAEVHRVIYDELCVGRIEPASRAAYLGIIEGLVERGAEGIVLGCTEIGLLVHETDVGVPLFDTALIHALAAVDWALGGNET